MRLRPILIDGMQGLGDNIYQRAALRSFCARHELGSVFLETSWPQLYADLPIRCVRPSTRLRTQRRNIHRWTAWAPRPHHRACRHIAVRYGADTLARGNIMQSMTRSLGLRDDVELYFDMPTFSAPQIDIPRGKPLCLIRPATLRREWFNPARNPDPWALRELSVHLARSGFFVVAAVDEQRGQEWIVEPGPFAHLTLPRLSTEELLGLVQSADLLVGGVGWLVPAAVAAGKPAFILLGGHGGHNAPEVITDPRMDLSRLGFAMPPNFCRCTDRRHACPKEIPDVVDQFRHFQRRCLEPRQRLRRASRGRTVAA